MQYEGGYSAAHPTVRAFWSVLHDLPLETKRKYVPCHFVCVTDPVNLHGICV